MSDEVYNGKWITRHTRAVCDERGCDWRYGPDNQAAAVRAARRHALAEGHRVWLDRDQSRYVEPADYVRPS